MEHTTADIRAAQETPDLRASDASLGDDTSGATRAEQERGWADVDEAQPRDDVGRFTVLPWAPEPSPGFLNRPSGMER